MKVFLYELALMISEAQLGLSRDLFRILAHHGIAFRAPFPDTTFDTDTCFTCLGKEKATRYKHFLNTWNISEVLSWYEEKNITVWTCTSPDYPSHLFHLAYPPVCLYIRGNAKVLSWELSDSIAVVGTRKPSSYGKAVTEALTGELVDSGFQIVSGLAYGIDAIAHSATLKKGGITVAVIAGDVSTMYPKRNEALGKAIIESSGVILSEYCRNTEVQPWMFPERNRVIAALSAGVLVPEGALKSGSLITATCAAEIGREIFAIPGSIFSKLSSGPHSLLTNGASIVSEIDDILAHFPEKSKIKKNVAVVQLTINEQFILDKVQSVLYTHQELVSQVDLPVEETMKVITDLEIKGVLKRGIDGSLQVVR